MGYMHVKACMLNKTNTVSFYFIFQRDDSTSSLTATRAAVCCWLPVRRPTPALVMSDVGEIYSQGTFSLSKDFCSCI